MGIPPIGVAPDADESEAALWVVGVGAGFLLVAVVPAVAVGIDEG